MKILKLIALVLVSVVAALVVIGLFLPSSAHVERSAVIESPPATVFTVLSDMRRFNDWSPWADLDPATRYEYSGPSSGVGAKMAWSSEDPDVGAGTQEIVASEPYSLVRTVLDFGEQGTAEGFYRIEPDGEGTRVTWGFDTSFGLNLVGRYFGLLFDSMVGRDFEKGLASLEALVEALPRADWSTLEVEVVDEPATPIVYVSASAPMDHAAIGAALAQAYGQLARFLAARGLAMAGQPLAINTQVGGDVYAFDAGIPVDPDATITLPASSPIHLGTTPGGKVAKAVHRGPYGQLPATYEKLTAYLAVHGLKQRDRSFERYVSDPGTTPEAELVTEVMIPVS